MSRNQAGQQRAWFKNGNLNTLPKIFVFFCHKCLEVNEDIATELQSSLYQSLYDLTNPIGCNLISVLGLTNPTWLQTDISTCSPKPSQVQDNTHS